MAHTQYRVNGKRVPSVTTVLGKFKDPGPLMYWANNTAVSVLEEAHHLIKQMVQHEGAEGFSRSLHDDLWKYLKSKPFDRANFRSISSKATEAGTIAHNLVEVWIHADEQTKKNLERQTPRDIQAVTSCPKQQAEQAHSSFSAFLTWVSTNKFTLLETEVQLTSETYNYGGTIDCIGTRLGKTCILDWKTSKALYADYLLQLAAYGQLWNENWDPPIEEYHLVRFDKATADFHHAYFSDLTNELEIFLRFRECYDLMKTTEKRIK